MSERMYSGGWGSILDVFGWNFDPDAIYPDGLSWLSSVSAGIIRDCTSNDTFTVSLGVPSTWRCTVRVIATVVSYINTVPKLMTCVLTLYRGADKSLAPDQEGNELGSMSGTRAISTTSRRELSSSFLSCKARHRRKFTPFWQKH